MKSPRHDTLFEAKARHPCGRSVVTSSGVDRVEPMLVAATGTGGVQRSDPFVAVGVGPFYCAPRGIRKMASLAENRLRSLRQGGAASVACSRRRGGASRG